MEIRFRGMCSGTEKRHSNKTGNDYTITKFVEVPSMSVLDVFGDLKLGSSESVQEYVLEGDVTGINNCRVVSASVGKSTVKA
jgi:hypothetical protein